MLQLDPAHRPSIAEVAAHKWMQGVTPTQEQVYAEFEKRNADVQASIKADKETKDEEKQNRIANRKKTIMRSTGGDKTTDGAQMDMSDDSLMKPKKRLEAYEHLFKTNTEFFSTYNPDMIEDALKESLENLSVAPQMNKDKYKMKFTLTTKDQGGQIQNVAIVVRILNVDDKTVCVEFSRKEGDMIRFHEHFLDFKNSVLNCMNDSIVTSKTVVV